MRIWLWLWAYVVFLGKKKTKKTAYPMILCQSGTVTKDSSGVNLMPCPSRLKLRCVHKNCILRKCVDLCEDYKNVWLCVCVCVFVCGRASWPMLWGFPAPAELALVEPEELGVTCQSTQQPQQQWTLYGQAGRERQKVREARKQEGTGGGRVRRRQGGRREGRGNSSRSQNVHTHTHTISCDECAQ